MGESIASTSMTTVRVGVIGFGLMGRTHAEAFHRDPRATLVAVADPHLSDEPASEGNLDAQEEFVLPEDVAIHASATDFLARDDIDAVVVAESPQNRKLAIFSNFRFCGGSAAATAANP